MPQDYTVVDDFVVVSNLVKANDKKFLSKHGITHVINTVSQHSYYQSSGSDSESLQKSDSFTLSEKSKDQMATEGTET
jgi:hypothetical protein